MLRNTLLTAAATTIVSATMAFADWSVYQAQNTTYVSNGTSYIMVGIATNDKENRQNKKEAKRLAKKLNKATK